VYTGGVGRAVAEAVARRPAQDANGEPGLVPGRGRL